METKPFAHLLPGRSYVVAQAFTDYDGACHAIGERWLYLGQSFLPYDDGLSLFVAIEGRHHQIRMQWRDDEQGRIIDDLAAHLVEAP